MKKYLLVLCLLVTTLVSCVSPGGGGGLIISTYSGPFQATSNSGRGKTGEATAYCILALVCFGDAGINKAASEGNINKITAIDYHYTSVFGILYNSTTTIVVGE